jgi:serine protease inhibitor
MSWNIIKMSWSKDLLTWTVQAWPGPSGARDPVRRRKAAFTDEADFSEISGKTGLSLDDLVHQTFIDVDEAGTAVATVAGFTTTAAHVPAEIRFDRPYLFVVRDGATGTVVFMGRVEDPTL